MGKHLLGNTIKHSVSYSMASKNMKAFIRDVARVKADLMIKVQSSESKSISESAIIRIKINF